MTSKVNRSPIVLKHNSRMQAPAVTRTKLAKNGRDRRRSSSLASLEHTVLADDARRLKARVENKKMLGITLGKLIMVPPEAIRLSWIVLLSIVSEDVNLLGGVVTFRPRRLIVKSINSFKRISDDDDIGVKRIPFVLLLSLRRYGIAKCPDIIGAR